MVRTNKAYDGKKIRAALQAKRPREAAAPGGGKRLLYAVKAPNLPLTVQLWLADERTLVLGLFSSMEDVPVKPYEGASQLPEEVREVLQQRLGAGTPLWLAGHSANWEKTVLPVLLGGLKDAPVMDRLKQVSTFALWLQPDQPPKVLGAFRCADEKIAKQIEHQDLAARLKKNPEAFKFSRDKEWLNVQMKMDPGRREGQK